MNKNNPDMNYKTPVNYGPETGKGDPGRQPVIADTPYEGDYSPNHRLFKPGMCKAAQDIRIVPTSRKR